MTITARDREASDALHVKPCPHGGRDACLCRECRAEAIAQAREEGRREEREQIHAALNDLPEPFAYKHDPARLDAFNEGVQHAMDSIRARGEV